MSDLDARKLSSTKLFNLRKRVINLRKQGMSTAQIAKSVGLGYDATKAAIQRYEEGGIEALRPRRKGRKQGTGRVFTQQQEDEIRYLLYSKKPYELGLTEPYHETKVRLWTRNLVRQLVENNYGIHLSSASLSKYLDRWGVRLKRKNISPIERCSDEIRQWLEENSWEEKMKEYSPEHTFFVVWQKIEHGKVAKRFSVVTALDGMNNEYWCVYPGNFTKKRQIGFLIFLLQRFHKKILVIRTQGSHFTHLKVRHFERSREKRIELIPPVLPGELVFLQKQQKNIQEAKEFRAANNQNQFDDYKNAATFFKILFTDKD